MARIAMVLAEDFEDSEFRKPYDALREAGHTVEVLGAEQGVERHRQEGPREVKIEAAAADCDPEDYDALVIPGGYSPDHLRTDKGVVEFVHEMVVARQADRRCLPRPAAADRGRCGEGQARSRRGRR